MWAMYPRAEKITNPAKILVNELVIDTIKASLEEEEIF